MSATFNVRDFLFQIGGSHKTLQAYIQNTQAPVFYSDITHTFLIAKELPLISKFVAIKR